MKKIGLVLVLSFFVIGFSYGQSDFKEIKTKTIKISSMANNKPMKTKNIIRIYNDSIVVSIDVNKMGAKMIASVNGGGGTVYLVKEINNGNPKMAVYKGKGIDITIDYSGKKPEIKLEVLDPNTGGKSIIVYF